jgi:hypothetical protein
VRTRVTSGKHVVSRVLRCHEYARLVSDFRAAAREAREAREAMIKVRREDLTEGCWIRGQVARGKREAFRTALQSLRWDHTSAMISVPVSNPGAKRQVWSQLFEPVTAS